MPAFAISPATAHAYAQANATNLQASDDAYVEHLITEAYKKGLAYCTTDRGININTIAALEAAGYGLTNMLRSVGTEGYLIEWQP